MVSYNPAPPESRPTAFANESWESYTQRLDEWNQRQDADIPLAFDLKPRGTVMP